MKQTIRIIGGLYRGKKILFPESEGLRPTSDRVRETLFNWLMQDIRGARCLDAFAGSGALGLEAFSRGASQVDFLEQSPMVYNHLNKIINSFNSPIMHALKTNALDYLKRHQSPYDIIFLDPPFTLSLIPQCLQIINESNLLEEDGLVYLESPNIQDFENSSWKQIKLKQAGQVFYGLLRKHH